MNAQRQQTQAGLSAEQAFICDALGAESRAIESIINQIKSNSSHAEMWTRAVDLLENCKGHAVFCGMGKPGLIGAKLSSTFSSIGQPSHVVHPSEAVHGDLGSIRRDDVVILMSRAPTGFVADAPCREFARLTGPLQMDTLDLPIFPSQKKQL